MKYSSPRSSASRTAASRSARAVFFLSIALIAAFGCLGLGAQEVEAWFSTPETKKLYASILPEIRELGASLVASGLSESILTTRLDEAAGKRVSADRLLKTLKADTETCLWLSEAMRSRGLLPADSRKASDLVEQYALLMRAGISQADFKEALEASAAKVGSKAATTRALAVLAVLASAKSTYRLSSSESAKLAAALASSDIADRKLSAGLVDLVAEIAPGKATKKTDSSGKKQ
ncbi:MAG TPA: hypothetical protein VIO60_00260 [Rectinemataceae bacterium]